jgi:hypothetical protein
MEVSPFAELSQPQLPKELELAVDPSQHRGALLGVKILGYRCMAASGLGGLEKRWALGS